MVAALPLPSTEAEESSFNLSRCCDETHDGFYSVGDFHGIHGLCGRHRFCRGLRPGQRSCPKFTATHPRHRGLLLLSLPALSEQGAVREGRGAHEALAATPWPNPPSYGNPDPSCPADLLAQPGTISDLPSKSSEFTIRSPERNGGSGP